MEQERKERKRVTGPKADKTNMKPSSWGLRFLVTQWAQYPGCQGNPVRLGPMGMRLVGAPAG